MKERRGVYLQDEVVQRLTDLAASDRCRAKGELPGGSVFFEGIDGIEGIEVHSDRVPGGACVRVLAVEGCSRAMRGGRRRRGSVGVGVCG